MPTAKRDFVLGNKMIRAGESYELPEGETEAQHEELGLSGGGDAKPEEGKPEGESGGEGSNPAEGESADPNADALKDEADPNKGGTTEIPGSPPSPHTETMGPAA